MIMKEIWSREKPFPINKNKAQTCFMSGNNLHVLRKRDKNTFSPVEIQSKPFSSLEKQRNLFSFLRRKKKQISQWKQEKTGLSLSVETQCTSNKKHTLKYGTSSSV
jgi:hypothetical protein